MDKKVIVIVIAVVVVAILGLGAAGIIPIPGLSPKKAKKHKTDASTDAKKDDAKAKDPADAAKAKLADAAKVKEAEDKAKTLAAKAAADKQAADQLVANQKGYKKLAGVWAEMKPNDVSALLVSHYKPEDAAPILKLMDEDQVAAIFTALQSKKEPAATAAGGADTASYCDALAKEVSKITPPDAAKS